MLFVPFTVLVHRMPAVLVHRMPVVLVLRMPAVLVLRMPTVLDLQTQVDSVVVVSASECCGIIAEKLLYFLTYQI